MTEQGTRLVVQRIGDNLDIIGGVLGVALGIAIILLSVFGILRQLSIGTVILAASGLYVLLHRQLKMPAAGGISVQGYERILLNIVFIGLVPVAAALWYSQPYIRPLAYFVTVALLAGILGIEILFFREGEPVWPLLGKIIVVSLFFRAGIFYNYPSIIGYDAYFHVKLADIISGTGMIPPLDVGSKYVYYPVLHVFIAMLESVCSIDVKDAVFLSIGVAGVVSTIFLFLIVKYIAGPQTGLFAVLLFNITNDVIVRGIANITAGSIVLCYFMLLLFLILFRGKHNSMTSTGFVIAVTLLMVLSHQLTTFVAFLSILALFIGVRVFHRLFSRKGGETNTFILSGTYLMLFAVALLTYWMHTFTGPGETIFESGANVFVSVIEWGGAYGSDVLIVGHKYAMSLAETLFLHSTHLILPFFAIGGTLLWLSQRDSRKFAIALSIGLLYTIIYGAPLLGVRALLTNRWLPFLSVFLVIVAAMYIMKSVDLLAAKKQKIFAIFVIVAVFAFLMVNTPSINKDNPIVAKSSTPRNQFMDSEIAAAQSIGSLCEGNVRLDHTFLESCAFYGTGDMPAAYADEDSGAPHIELKRRLRTFDEDYLNGNVTDLGGMFVLIRRATYSEPITVQASELYGDYKAIMIPGAFFERLKTAQYDQVYDNAYVAGYVRI